MIRKNRGRTGRSRDRLVGLELQGRPLVRARHWLGARLLDGLAGFVSARSTHACGSPPRLPPPLTPPPFPPPPSPSSQHPQPSTFPRFWRFLARAAFRAASRCPGGGGGGKQPERFQLPSITESHVLLILPLLVPIAGLPPRHLQFLLPGWAEGNSWALLPSVVVIRRLKCSKYETDVCKCTLYTRFQRICTVKRMQNLSNFILITC